MPLEQPTCVIRVRGDEYPVALPLQQSPGQLANFFRTFNHEHRFCPDTRREPGGGASATISAASLPGKYTLNDVPLPTSLKTVMVPPLRATMP